jgi:hypothetical protein
MELGGDFAFVGRQRRLRIGNSWYRVDLLFFHRRLRSLVVIDLKIGELTPADTGQMNVYLNYAREYRLVLPDEKRLAEEIEATRKRWEGRSRSRIERKRSAKR